MTLTGGSSGSDQRQQSIHPTILTIPNTTPQTDAVAGDLCIYSKSSCESGSLVQAMRQD